MDDKLRFVDKAVFIIRNPNLSALAEFNRLKNGHTGHAKEEIFATQGDDLVASLLCTLLLII